MYTTRAEWDGPSSLKNEDPEGIANPSVSIRSGSDLMVSERLAIRAKCLALCRIRRGLERPLRGRGLELGLLFFFHESPGVSS